MTGEGGEPVTVLCPSCLHDGVLERTLARAEAAEAALEAAEARLAAIRETLATSLTDTGDDLGVLERPADDSAMLDRALRLISRLLAIIGTEEAGDG